MMESLIVGATLMLVLLVVAEILVGRKGASRK